MINSISCSSLVSLHFELEDVTLHKKHPEPIDHQVALVAQKIAATTRPVGAFQQRLLRDVLYAKFKAIEEDGDYDVTLIASYLSSVGYTLSLRTAIGGGHGTAIFQNLHNEFLIITGEADALGKNFIVETNFKEHFEIKRSTDRYDAVLDSVPSEIVVTEHQLKSLVQLVCAEMALAFQARELSLPPWRSSKSILTKWLPRRSVDNAVHSPTLGSPTSSARLQQLNTSSIYTTPSGLSSPVGYSDDDEDDTRGSMDTKLARHITDAFKDMVVQTKVTSVKLKSMLSADLAAIDSPKTPCPQYTSSTSWAATPTTTTTTTHCQAGWQAPPIRTVKLKGFQAS